MLHAGASTPVSTRIYGGGAIASGGAPAVATLAGAGYDAVIVWTNEAMAPASTARAC